MGEIPNIETVMTRLPHSIDADANLAQAKALMEREGVRHLPVTNGGSLVGIVTDRDIKQSLDPLVDMPPMRRVRDLMIKELYVVEPDAPLDEVLHELADRRIGCALVAKDGNLLGILTTTDATRLLAEHLRNQS